MKKFYISTPIYYPSGKPHIGHAYSTILADIFKRYKKILGYDTFFITGTDEHGKKIEESAKKANMHTLDYLNHNVDIFKHLWTRLGIEYDYFIRTTQNKHINAVQKIFSFYWSNQLIYLDQWKGLYCVSCEENYTAKDAIKKDGHLVCQHGHILVDTNEESFFFKMSQYQEWIMQTFSNHEIDILPASRVQELKNNFLKEKLNDLSISRTSFSWGIKILENQNHVIYVWMDALMNYITGLGYMSDDDSLFKKYWMDQECEKIHLLSKEITRFHCIYWPIFLKCLNLPLPTKIISHGWIITPEGKMSKSLGNVIDPNQLLDIYNREILRYYFIKDMSLDNDNVFSIEAMIGTYNGDLANNYGNLISRSLGMLKKYNNNIIPDYNSNNEFNDSLQNLIKMHENYYQFANDLKIQKILNAIQDVINQVNKLIEETKPWDLFKNNDIKKINDLLYLLFKTIEICSFWLQPILIDSIKEVERQTNIAISNKKYEDILKLESIQKIQCNESKPIFVRLQKEKND